MQKVLENIELDIKDLRYLLEVAPDDPNIVRIAKRRVQEIVERLEVVHERLDVVPLANENSIEKEYPAEAEPVDEREEEVEDMPVAVEKEEPEIISQIIATEDSLQEPVAEKYAETAVLGEQLKPAADLRKCFTLNDTFRFSRELFGGDTEEMNNVLQKIEGMHSMTEVMSYFSALGWDEENEAVNDFIELLRRYFV